MHLLVSCWSGKEDTTRKMKMLELGWSGKKEGRKAEE